jgi:membrane-anchored mycosin MYCP
VPCSGTSFAAPFVAGLAALLRSRYPQMPAGELKRRIELTADHPSTDLPSEEQGYGVINPLAAMTAVLPSAEPPAAPAAPPLSPPPTPDHRERATGLAVAGAALLLALLIVAAARIVPVGHRRRWRPGR